MWFTLLILIFLCGCSGLNNESNTNIKQNDIQVKQSNTKIKQHVTKENKSNTNINQIDLHETQIPYISEAEHLIGDKTFDWILLCIAALTGWLVRYTHETSSEKASQITESILNRLPWKQKIVYQIMKWILHSRRKKKK